MVPAQGILAERQVRWIPPVCSGPGTCSWPRDALLYESRALPRAYARQGKESVHLVGNRTILVGRQGRHRCYWWSCLMSLSATHSVRDNDNGCLNRKLIKCLTDSADDLSSLRAYTHCLHVGIRVWAPPQRSLVREPSDVSSTAG